MRNPLTRGSSAIQVNKSSTPAITENNPKWIRLNQLPGLMWSAIRAMGESVFGPLTRTPLEQIEVIANLSGQGPHTQQAIDITANQLRRQAEPSSILEYTSEQMRQYFGALYQAQAVQFEEKTHTYLLVRDPVGSYIYRWPIADTKRRLGRLGEKRSLLIDRK